MNAYVCRKACAVAALNMMCDWPDAAEEMWLVAKNNMRCRTKTYHLMLSWPETECPTDEQAIAAMKVALAELGLKDHQAVIAVHRDGANVHVHAVVNRIHPTTFNTMSTSNDFAKLEKACRKIELAQGWSADRGRFDVEVTHSADGPEVKLVHKPQEHLDEKLAQREAGRGPTPRDIHTERRTGLAPLTETLSDAWKMRVRTAMDGAADWAAVHAALGALGLSYAPFGSGARITLRGSDSVLSPSTLGKRYALAGMQKRLGPWIAPGDKALLPAPQMPKRSGGCLRQSPASDAPLSRAQTFKQTLLARTYAGLTLDDAVVQQIKRVDLDKVPPYVTLMGGGVVVDEGDAITTSRDGDATIRARLAVAMAVAKGWSDCTVDGSRAFKRAVARAAADAGLTMSNIPDDIAAEIAAEQTTEPKADPVTAPRAPAGPRMAHAEADAARTDAAAARAAETAARAALAAQQQADRDALAALVGRRRDPLSQAMRQGLGMQHADQRRERQAKSPRRPPVPAVPLSAQDRRRRAAGRAMTVPLGDLQRALDHTTCRQLWMAADVQVEHVLGHKASVSDNEASGDPHRDVRVIEGGLHLVAQRDPRDNIVGFEYARMQDDGTVVSALAEGGRAGLYRCGDIVTATRVVITPWAMDAITLETREARADTLYVAVGGEIGSRVRNTLRILLQDRDIVVACEDTDTGDAFAAQVAGFHMGDTPIERHDLNESGSVLLSDAGADPPDTDNVPVPEGDWDTPGM
jgi:hypothetical protein